MVVTNGFSRGVFVSRFHDPFFCNNVAFVSSPFFHHHHHSFFSFSLGFGFGFPYYAYYYSSYPYWWWDPWYYPYPYAGGVYVGYPAYPYYYYGDPYYRSTYIYNNNYYSGTPTSSEAPTEPESSYAPAPSAAGASQEGVKAEITPLPKAEEMERAEAETVPESGRPGSVARDSGRALDTALTGLASFRDGRYPEASDSLYEAVQADPISPSLKVYLAESLFAIGEYKFAADYLRQALITRPSLALEPFDLGRLYAPTPGGQEDLDRHLRSLKEYLDLQPYDADALLVLGFLQLQNGNLTGAAGTLLAHNDYAENPVSQNVASQLFAAIQLKDPSLAGGLKAEGPAPLAESAGEPEGAPTQDELGQALSSALY